MAAAKTHRSSATVWSICFTQTAQRQRGRRVDPKCQHQSPEAFYDPRHGNRLWNCWETSFSHELLKCSWYFGGDCNHLFPKPAILKAVWFHTDYLPPTYIVGLSGRRSTSVTSTSRCLPQCFQRSPKQGHLLWLQAALVHVLGGWTE